MTDVGQSVLSPKDRKKTATSITLRFDKQRKAYTLSLWDKNLFPLIIEAPGAEEKVLKKTSRNKLYLTALEI